MDLGLKGKVIMITGAASGLGKATAEHLAAEGARLVLTDVDKEGLHKAADELRSCDTEVLPSVLDVRDYAASRSTVEAACRHFDRVDALVNSAGIGGSMAFFADSGPADWEALVGINLLGVMNCCRAVTDTMIEQRYGKIVSIASEAGRANEKRMVVYGTTKGGVISLTRGLAAELGRYGINVNAVCPGVTHTPMTSYIDEAMEDRARPFYPMGRLGVPEDIAPMITFLCSDRTSWMTGQAVSVNGGFGRS